MKVKVLSIQNPWATLILKHLKSVELRTWNTNYRGRLYIHVTEQNYEADVHMTDKSRRRIQEVIWNELLPEGTIIGYVSLDRVITYHSVAHLAKDKVAHRVEHVSAYKSFPVYGLVMLDPRLLCEPIRAKGQLNVWNFEIEGE